MTNKIQDIIEENEKEFGERFYWEELFGKNSKAEKVAKDFLKQSQLRLLEGVGEMIEELPEKPANLTPQQQSGYEIGIMAVLSLLPETKCTCPHPTIESNMTVAHCVKCRLELSNENKN